MMEIKSFLFDLDGVVIDSELMRDNVTRKLVNSFGQEYDRDKLKPLMSGKSSVDCMRVLIDAYSLDISAEELDKSRRQEICELYRTKIPYIPNFLRFFKQLRNTFDASVAVASGCDREYFELVDKRLGITKLFDSNIFLSNLLPEIKQKPCPDIFIYATRSLGVNPEECAVFEDAPNGIAASIRAGVRRTIVLTRTFTKQILVKETNRVLKEDNIKLKERGNVLFIQDYSPNSLDEVVNYLKQK